MGDLPELPKPPEFSKAWGVQHAFEHMAKEYARSYALEAVRQEREACAKLCDTRSQWIAGTVVPNLPEQFKGADSFANGAWQEAETCAAAIRARVDATPPQGGG